MGHKGKMFSLFDPIYSNTKEFPVKLKIRRIDIVTYCLYTWNTFNPFETFHNKIKHNARSSIWYLLQRICLFNQVGKSQFVNATSAMKNAHLHWSPR